MTRYLTPIGIGALLGLLIVAALRISENFDNGLVFF